MEKITAVEYLVSIVQKCIAPNYIPVEIVQQAKAMEKENMYQVWKTSEDWSDGKLLDSKKSFEEYYNETYNK